MIDYNKLLETYCLEDILEMNNISEYDVVRLLYEEGFLEIPVPVDA